MIKRLKNSVVKALSFMFNEPAFAFILNFILLYAWVLITFTGLKLLGVVK